MNGLGSQPINDFSLEIVLLVLNSHKVKSYSIDHVAQFESTISLRSVNDVIKCHFLLTTFNEASHGLF